ncbi:MAG: hypothetical protein AAF628_13830 [Planctomycetota bacterium]
MLEVEANESLEAFIRRVVSVARRDHSLVPGDLADAIRTLCCAEGNPRPTVYVVECSAWQCESHVKELRATFDVDARPWPLTDGEAPPNDGVILSTYFHYNDVRRAWPRRLKDVHFLEIRLDPDVVISLCELRESSEGRLRIWVVERDMVTAETVAADVTALLPRNGFAVSAREYERPRDALESLDDGSVAVFAPRVWGVLTDRDRAHPQSLEARYVFDAKSLADLGCELRWAQLTAASE